MQYRFVPFLVIGIAFIVLGINGQRTFFYVGITFLVLALALAIRKHK